MVLTGDCWAVLDPTFNMHRRPVSIFATRLHMAKRRDKGDHFGLLGPLGFWPHQCVASSTNSTANPSRNVKRYSPSEGEPCFGTAITATGD